MKEDIQKLLDHCVEYASELLSETGEAYPFGGFIDTVGNPHPMEMEIDKKNVPNIGRVIETLKKLGQQEMAAGTMTGYALTYEAEVQISDEEKMDCIAIDIIHQEEEVPVYYLPFTKDASGNVVVGQLFAVKRP